jgi:hypothetical protein
MHFRKKVVSIVGESTDALLKRVVSIVGESTDAF